MPPIESQFSPAQRAILSELGIDLWVTRRTQAQSVAATGGSDAELLAEDSAPVVTAPEVSGSWDELDARIRGCTRCPLHASRTQAVCGVGNRTADWLVIGEAPGADEDREGEPFLGKAGQLLNEMLVAAGQPREQVFISNVLKCRPPDNRDPTTAEVEQCLPYLQEQIQRLQPKVILLVGRIAAQTLLQSAAPIGKLRGQVYTYGETGIPMVVTYHPAYLLRRPAQKRKSWDDLMLAMDAAAGRPE